MSKTIVMIFIPLLVISGLYAIPGIIPHANAAHIGEVCIAKAGNTSCPPIAPLLSTSGTIPTQLLVAIVIDSSEGLDAFDITLLTNSTILKPAGFSLGSVLTAPSTNARCIGGVGGVPAGCTSNDNQNTLHVAASSQGLTFFPTTGLLFTANYTVMGTAYSSPVGFSTGCGSGTSVAGGVCITISNGNPISVQETSQTAKFTDQPYFDLQPVAPIASLTILEGSTNSSLFLNVTSINGFSGTISLINDVLPTNPSGLTVTITTSPLKVSTTSPNNFTNVVVAVASVLPGMYSLNFTGTSGALPPNSILIPLIIPAPDLAITPNPETVRFNVSASGSAQIIVSSVANFAGIVNLTLAVPSNLRADLLNTSLNVTGGGTLSTTLTVNSTIAGSYNLNITGTSISKIAGTSFPLSHTSVLTIVVLDFQMTVPQGALIIPQGSTTTETVTLESVQLQVYNVNVTLTIIINRITSNGPIGPAQGITVTCNPTKVTLTSVGTSALPANSQCLIMTQQVGNYTVTIVGASGTVTRGVTFPVQVTGPDFTVVPTPTILTVALGNSSNISVLLTGKQGLSSAITLSADFGGTPNSPTVSINVQQILLNSTYPNATAIIKITVSSTAPTGTYSLTLTALAKSFSITRTASVVIVVTSTTSRHRVAVNSVIPATTSATVGSSVSLAVDVQNLGIYNETLTVIAIVGEMNVAEQNVSLTPGQSMTVTQTWNTNGFSPGAYTVGGKILGVPGQTNLDSNIYRSPASVTLTAANTSVFQSSYLEPTIIVALVVVLAAIGVLFLQSRRRTRTQ